jgi:1,2-diacylglycerol 3-alpha-glucosyltransferase
LLLAKGVKSHLDIIPSAISSFYSDRNIIMPTKKRTGDYFELLCVSRFAPEKNLYFLLDLFSIISEQNYRFTLIGFGQELEGLRNYAFKKLAIDDRKIQFIIKPSKQEISKWYAQADLFLFSSQTETQGLVLAESMAHGTPVVALRGPGVNDIVITGYNGFLVNSAPEMINCIKMLKARPDLLKQLQEGAWHTSDLYRPSNIAKELHNFYNKIIKIK